MKLTVKQLADSAGITIRTLHYYDKIGLLKPVTRSKSGYRYYDMDAVLTLQQIMFFRELEFSLDDIKTIVLDENFNLMEALRHHRELLRKQKSRIDDLLGTLERTMESRGKENYLAIEDYYSGFSEEEVAQYREKVKYCCDQKSSEERETEIERTGKMNFIEVQAEGGRIFKTIYANMSKGHKSPFIQEQIELWRQWLENFHHHTDDEVLRLGKAYSQTRDYAFFFDQYDRDLPMFLTKAIKHYISKKKRRSLRRF